MSDLKTKQNIVERLVMSANSLDWEPADPNGVGFHVAFRTVMNEYPILVFPEAISVAALVITSDECPEIARLRAIAERIVADKVLLAFGGPPSKVVN